MREGDCIHGYARFECAICYHPAGCCDYGHCQAKATRTVRDVNGAQRPMCTRHAKVAARLQAQAAAMNTPAELARQAQLAQLRAISGIQDMSPTEYRIWCD